MTKHTPGPWSVFPRKSYAGKIDLIPVGMRNAGGDYTVASIHAYGENAEANARLIAAAPEMYEALRALAPMMGLYLDGCEPKGAALSSALQSAYAAIFKAEGTHNE